MPKPFECSSGSYTGDATGFDIDLGFKPKMVIIFNQTDGDQLSIHIDGMTDDTAISIVGLVSLIAANGLTLNDDGFSVGSDDSVCENLKVFKYVAIGGN